MDKKLTAVEWLEEKMEVWGDLPSMRETILKIAKQMEKEQIMDAYTADCDTLGHTNSFKAAAEQYYNKTFKSE